MNKRKFKRAFTLMELMIVIVIIGILATVGMVMFGGQAEKAKIASTKSIHKQVVTYITVEMMNCSMGDERIMGGSLPCSERTPMNVVSATVNSLVDHKNPYQVDKTALSQVSQAGLTQSSNDAGFIRLSVSGQNIIVESCHTQPCSAADERDEKTIAFQ